MLSATWKIGMMICAGLTAWLLATCAGSAQARTGGNGGEAAKAGKTVGAQAPEDEPALPAKMWLRGGKLTVEADNSDLAEILRDLATTFHMSISGLDEGPRVFGVYGPGDLRGVLSSLLIGSGYDFVMAGGRANGMPRELLLMHPDDGAKAAHASARNDDSESGEPKDAENGPTEPEERGPGAVYPVPPPGSQDENTRIQQTLQRLKRMHQQQESAPKQ